MRTIKVKTNDLRVGKAPDTLSTRGIGSCVAVALYNPPGRMGGLAHISLAGGRNRGPGENPYRYAKNAIETILGIMENMGCLHLFTVAKIVGGADMFGFDKSPLNDIGKMNVEAVRGELEKQLIPIVAEDVLGTEGRNVSFELSTGNVRVSGAEREEIHL